MGTRAAIHKYAVIIGISGFALAYSLGTANAQQFDAPYYEFEKKHGPEWAKEDKAIDAKLAELEEKFGKKPNIIGSSQESVHVERAEI